MCRGREVESSCGLFTFYLSEKACDVVLHVLPVIRVLARTNLCAYRCCARMQINCPIWAPVESVPTMRCVICLESSPNARRSCGCSARTCAACLLALLDRGADRCVVCGPPCMPSRCGGPVCPAILPGDGGLSPYASCHVMASRRPSLPYGGCYAGRAWVALSTALCRYSVPPCRSELRR